MKLGAITCEEASVDILGGACEAAHERRATHCRFYDVTPVRDARFIVALRRSQTREGVSARTHAALSGEEEAGARPASVMSDPIGSSTYRACPAAPKKRLRWPSPS